MTARKERRIEAGIKTHIVDIVFYYLLSLDGRG
jgi:hypothetical protein